jgi:hypothetical protein
MLASSGVVVIRNDALTASHRPLDLSSATDETTMNGNNEDAAATMVHKRRKVCKTFDERFKDLMAFKAEFGQCNVPLKKSNKNTHYSLGIWCSNMRQTFKAVKEGGIVRCKLSKTDMKRLENAGFEWRSK